ncbi:MAG: OmpA family protein [Burkholderiaceae bacterium]|jgi:outer membrane protein OmpA-like peptidoglycan-associated protein|nr:OmpA family protein [Burkholderiaceae bacterium]
MFSQEDDGQGVALGVVFGIIALVIALVIGLAIHKTGNKAPAKPAAVAAAPAAADAASVKVENGVVKFYFASGKAEVAAGAADALADVVKGVAAGKKAVVSGFHDSTGDPARNAELAKERALAVRAALQALGVGEDRVELKKPEEMQASGPNAEARRVEVTLQ